MRSGGWTRILVERVLVVVGGLVPLSDVQLIR